MGALIFHRAPTQILKEQIVSFSISLYSFSAPKENRKKPTEIEEIDNHTLIFFIFQQTERVER